MIFGFILRQGFKRAFLRIKFNVIYILSSSNVYLKKIKLKFSNIKRLKWKEY